MDRRALRPASTVVLVRERAGSPELLFVKRPDSMRFLGGFHAFPGGALDPDDYSDGARELSVLSPDEAAEAMGDAASPYQALGFYVCALRELFEEVGILIVDSRGADEIDPERIRAARRELVSGQKSFSRIVSDLGIRLGTQHLGYHTRWTAPEALPVRFDVRVFVATSAGEPDPNPTEVSEVEWVSPGNALAMAEIGNMLLAPPTVATISSLSRFNSAETMVQGLRTGMRSNAPEELSPLVRRILAPNASIMTGPGTNTYLVGKTKMVVIDPASMDRAHLKTISESGDVSVIVVTHHHPDHASGALDIAEMTGAPLAASPRFFERFAADVHSIHLADGATVMADGSKLEAIETPGHASDHICLWLAEERALFSGDLVLGEGTTVISPPDGNLRDYLHSLEKVAALRPELIYPGHFGHRVDGSDWIDWYIRHRIEREQEIIDAMSEGAATIPEIVRIVYRDYPRSLHAVAERSVLAHLGKLEGESRVREDAGTYRLNFGNG